MLKRVEIQNIKSKKDLVDIIRKLGQKAVADHLSYLDTLDIFNTNHEPLVLESLQGFTIFVLDREKFPVPEINLGTNGVLVATWKNKKYGTLSIQFLDEKYIRFIFNLFDKESIIGTLTQHSMYDINKTLIERFGL